MSIVDNGKFLGSDKIIPYPVARRGSVSDSYPLSTLFTERLSTNIIRGISPNDGSFIYNDVGALVSGDNSEIIFFIYGYFFQTTVDALYTLCSSYMSMIESTAYIHACINIDKTTSSDFWELTKINNSATSGASNTLDYEIDSVKSFIGLTFILSDSNEDLSDDNYKTLCLVKAEKSGTETIFTMNESTKYAYFALTQPYILCEAASIDESDRSNEVPAIGNDPYTQRKLWVQINYDSSGNAVLRFYNGSKWQIVGSVYK